MMFPGGKNEQAPFGTGIKTRASGFGKVGETIFLQKNERTTGIKGGTHDGFLSRGYAGRNQYGTTLG